MESASPVYLKWRIINTESGIAEVTLVLPILQENGQPELLLETGIQVDNYPVLNQEFPWSSHDVVLFTRLFGHKVTKENQVTFELNLADPSVIEIINIVASARFSETIDLRQIDMSPGFQTQIKTVQLGEVVSINTDQGFKLAVVTALSLEDLSCVILEPFYEPDSHEYISIHDVVRISRVNVLPAEFGTTLSNESDILH